MAPTKKGKSDGDLPPAPEDEDDDDANDDGGGGDILEKCSNATSTVCGDSAAKELPMPLGMNSNMNEIYLAFHRHHYVVTRLILNNKDFLIPAKRTRLWFLWCNYRKLRVGPEVALERLHRAQTKILQQREVLKDKRLPMEKFVLEPANHPILLEEMDRRQAKLLQKVKSNA